MLPRLLTIAALAVPPERTVKVPELSTVVLMALPGARTRCEPPL
jgi:hypothetical protein